MSNEQTNQIFGIPVDGSLAAHAGALMDNAIMDGSLFTGVTSSERIRRAGEMAVPSGPLSSEMKLIISVIIFAFVGFMTYAWVASMFQVPQQYIAPPQRTDGLSRGSVEYAFAVTIARTYDANGNVTREYTLRDQIPPNAVYDSNAYHDAKFTLDLARKNYEDALRSQRNLQQVQPGANGSYGTLFPPEGY